MTPHIYGAIGMTLGLTGFLSGLRLKHDLGGLLMIGGIFLFGCGLVASAITARRSK